MSIRLLEAISVAGVYQPVNTQLTLNTALEADLVNQGKAVYVSRTLAPGEGLVHAQFATDASGNVTGLVGPDGYINALGRRSTPVRVALFGDSTAYPGFWNSPSDGSDTNYYATAAFPASGATVLGGFTLEKWPLGLYYPKAKLVAPFGSSGESTTTMLARDALAYGTTRRAISDVWAQSPDVTIVRAGINDVQALTSASSQATIDAIKTRIETICNRILLGGGVVILEGMFGLSTAVADIAFMRAALVEINAAMQAYASTKSGLVYYLETSGLTHDGTGAYISGMTSDNIHLAPAGGVALGRAEAALMTRLFGRADIAYEGKNLLSNALMLTTESAAYGTIATGYAAAHSHATYQNAAVETRDGITYQTCEFVADGTAGASGTIYFPWQPNSYGTSANAVFGVEFDFFVESDDGGAPLTPVVGILARIDTYKSGAGRVVLDQANLSYAVGFDGAFTGHLVMAPFKCVEAAAALTSSSNGFIKYSTNAAGTFRMGIGNPRAVQLA